MHGIIHSYIHPGDPIGVLIELDSETDFVARMPEFKELAHEIALQVAASNPRYLSIDDIPAADAEEMRERFRQDAIKEGRFKKYAQENVLLEQPYVRDDAKTIKQLVSELASQTREKIGVGRVVRWEIDQEPRPRQRFVRPPRPDDDDGLQGAPVLKPDLPPHIPGRDAVAPSEE